MAIRLTISAEDAKRGKKVKNGWYRTRVTEIKEELNKAKDATNIVVDLVGMEGDALGVPVRHYISEKFPTGAVVFLTSFGVPVGEEGGTFDFEGLRNREVNAQWNYDADQKRNTLVDFAPLTAGIGATTATTAPAPGEF